jgi:hypothetical protein
MKKIIIFGRGKSSQGTPADKTAPAVKLKTAYTERFLKPKEFKERQSVYVSKEIHTKIVRLVHVLALDGIQISVGGFIDNILAEHMEAHKEDIAGLYVKQLSELK